MAEATTPTSRTPYSLVPVSVVAVLADLSPSAVRLAVALGAFADRNGRGWASRKALMKRSGVRDIRSFAAALKELKAATGLTVTRRRRSSSIYQWPSNQEVAPAATSRDIQEVAPAATSKNQEVALHAQKRGLEVALNATGNMPKKKNMPKRHEDDTRSALGEVLESWNQTAQKHGLPKAMKLGVARERALRARLADAYWREHWRDALERIGQSSFLCGSNERGWKADLGWFAKPDSVLRILEGRYDDRKPNPAARSDAFGADVARKYAALEVQNVG
jgi:hypothetical protein